jgi:small-conductance mechanosensitive channel
VSLATQNVASQLVGGLFLDLTNRIRRGDSVKFGSNAAGESKVEKVGWLHTEMRGADDVKVVVPNKQLVDKEVSNLSRVKISQVQQKLQFKSQDIDNVQELPNVMESIKSEIQSSCPTVSTDGSRPFRAHWTNVAGGKLEVVVDVHFRIPSTSEKYWDNRQEVLLVITRAVEQHNLQLA